LSAEMLIIIFFNCNKYTEERRELISNITDVCGNMNVSLQLLFHGSTKLQIIKTLQFL